MTMHFLLVMALDVITSWFQSVAPISNHSISMMLISIYILSVHFQVNEILFCFQNGVEEVYLFDPQLLEELEFDDQKCAAYKPDISPTHPGEGLSLRPLCISDFDKGNAQGLPSSFL